MLPIILHHQHIKALVIGDGPATTRRVEMLEEARMNFEHIKNSPLKELEEEHFDNPVLYPFDCEVIFIADFDEETSGQLYEHYRSQGLLVNIEDKSQYCDFHVPAIMRRDDLLLTVSTNAKSPRLARRIRMMLEQLFPTIWGNKLNELGELRQNWRTQGDSFEALAKKSDQWLDEQGLLEVDCACLQKQQLK